MGAHYRNCRANGAKVTQPLEPKKERLPACAPEGQEQATLFNWADAQARMGIYPELALMFHIPNGGKRSKAEAGRFRAEGVKAGVPDICLPVPRGKFHGLYIEMKKLKGGTVSREQKEWGAQLARQGYCWKVCHGWAEARDVLTEYLGEREYEFV